MRSRANDTTEILIAYGILRNTDSIVHERMGYSIELQAISDPYKISSEAKILGQCLLLLLENPG